ncbi:MAG: hypothetical protein HY695_28445 [Deltaproteobacteria bacterium]|nr:hypothetical protein [Deltaproteobacteria bacterium]
MIDLLGRTGPFSETLPAGIQAVVAGSAQKAADFHVNPPPAAQCASCHAEHFQDWSRSSHARSLTSEGFLRTFPQYLDFVGIRAREDPQVSMACFNCHAPLLKNADSEIIRRVAAFVVAKDINKLDGFEVGCVACHAEGNGVFSGPIRNPKGNLFHASKFSASYKEASFCATCHTWAPASIPCSDVYSDWKKSRAAKQGTTCQACHMAERVGITAVGLPQRKIRSHIVPGGRSADLLQKAVALHLKAAFRQEHLEVTATVRNLTPHRVPDG